MTKFKVKWGVYEYDGFYNRITDVEIPVTMEKIVNHFNDEYSSRPMTLPVVKIYHVGDRWEAILNPVVLDTRDDDKYGVYTRIELNIAYVEGGFAAGSSYDLVLSVTALEEGAPGIYVTAFIDELPKGVIHT